MGIRVTVVPAPPDAPVVSPGAERPIRVLPDYLVPVDQFMVAFVIDGIVLPRPVVDVPNPEAAFRRILVEYHLVLPVILVERRDAGCLEHYRAAHVEGVAVR